jgi:hypothetical protein
MICKNCQREISDDSKFCTFCGAPVEPESSTEPEIAPTPDQGTPAFMPTPAPVSQAASVPIQIPIPQPAVQQPSAAPAPGQPYPTPSGQTSAGANPPTTPPGYTLQPASSSYGSYPTQGQQAPVPGQQAQPVYQSYAAPAFQPEPAKKKKSPALFVVIGVAAIAVLAVVLILWRSGGGTGGGTGGGSGGGIVTNNDQFWSGGTTSSSLPERYTAIVDNQHLTIGVREAFFYGRNEYANGDDTVWVEVVVVNRSDYPIWVVLLDNRINGTSVENFSAAGDLNIWCNIDRVEPGETREGRIWFDTVHDLGSFNSWSSNVTIYDDDTYYSDEDLFKLDEYRINLIYRH